MTRGCTVSLSVYDLNQRRRGWSGYGVLGMLCGMPVIGGSAPWADTKLQKYRGEMREAEIRKPVNYVHGTSWLGSFPNPDACSYVCNLAHAPPEPRGRTNPLLPHRRRRPSPPEL